MRYALTCFGFKHTETRQGVECYRLGDTPFEANLFTPDGMRARCEITYTDEFGAKVIASMVEGPL